MHTPSTNSQSGRMEHILSILEQEHAGAGHESGGTEQRCADLQQGPGGTEQGQDDMEQRCGDTERGQEEALLSALLSFNEKVWELGTYCLYSRLVNEFRSQCTLPMVYLGDTIIYEYKF